MKENTLSITLISLFFKCKWQIKELFVSTCFWTRLVILCFVFCFILVSSQPQTPLLQAILGKPRILCNTFWLCALWRSILTKIQCCILHSTFPILSYICRLTSEFTLSSFNFPRATFYFSLFILHLLYLTALRSSNFPCATFKFLPCTFTLSYAIFKFSGLYFQVFPFNIEHFGYQVFAFNIWLYVFHLQVCIVHSTF